MVILDLVQKITDVAEGDTVTVPLPSIGDADVVASWCARTGNTLLTTDGRLVTVLRGRPADPIAGLPPDRAPGARVWLYTNFDCNLACDYCCVRSSPATPRRGLGTGLIGKIAAQAPAAGVSELLLTGGEPFLLWELADIVAICTAALPTTLLTNGMLLRGRRLDMLRAMPRDRLTLQVSIDSATRDRHDAHRGAGSWARAVDGVRTAHAEGFTVRVAATLTTPDPAEERALRAFLDSIGVPRTHQLVRPLARRGHADTGVELTVQTLTPEVTITADGAFWHPVGADDADCLVAREVLPLNRTIERVRELFREHHRAATAAARSFPCA
jgi:pyruvate-formate lyase-activating enzyme